jgi:hypothetical protein
MQQSLYCPRITYLQSGSKLPDFGVQIFAPRGPGGVPVTLAVSCKTTELRALTSN